MVTTRATESREATRERAPVSGRVAIKRVIAAYDDPITRAYSWGRFKIFRQRFLDEIGQYLPARGRVLDVGCGFGLFANYFAQLHPSIEIHGFDLSETRVALARRAAERIGVANAHFEVANATDLRARERFDAIYMLDVVHHVPVDAVRPMLAEIRASLSAGGVLLVKDLDTEPAWQRIFSHALDLAMSPSMPPRYWSQSEMMEMLRGLGLEVKRHAMVDILPYPHMLYIATRV